MGALRPFFGPARAAVFFGFLLAFVFAPNYRLTTGIFLLAYATMSVAWNLVGGFAGYPSLGHAAFYGIGAYFTAIWFQHGLWTVTSGYEPFLLLPLVGLVGAAVGYPFAVISMRTRSDVFAIVTITLLFVFQVLATNLRSLTGGSSGIAMPRMPFPADTFERPFYLVMVALLALSMAITWGVMRSKVGLSLAAVRADEDKAAGIGVHTNGVKVLAFCVSVGLTAMVGAVVSSYQFYIYPQFSFDPLVTIGIVLMTFLGGRATLWGPVLGAFILYLGKSEFAYYQGAGRLYLIFYALVFLVVMLFMPRGILPTLQEKLRFRRARAAGPTATSSDGGAEQPSGKPASSVAPTTMEVSEA